MPQGTGGNEPIWFSLRDVELLRVSSVMRTATPLEGGMLACGMLHCDMHDAMRFDAILRQVLMSEFDHYKTAQEKDNRLLHKRIKLMESGKLKVVLQSHPYMWDAYCIPAGARS